MKKIIVIGSGISGMTCAISCAEDGNEVILLSPYSSERAQSVMAAGGINAVLDSDNGDSVEAHIMDTFKAGGSFDDREAIGGLCSRAGDIVRWLDRIGVVFSREGEKVARRAFGGQSYVRTCYAGAATGKQIVSALVFKCREYEAKGLIKRILNKHFYSALIEGERCYGALCIDEITGELHVYYSDALVMATRGQNVLFGKTTGSVICDGYAAGRLFSQGVQLRNLEFIQYHPTTVETAHKRMLISEAARGEGGRLYYLDGDRRVYFMEEKYGPKGNLMPRDIVSKCIYDCPSQVYLDISFLGEQTIKNKLLEIYELCQRYVGIDVTKESIPVYPSVHFFMGGIDTDINHMTNIKGLYAVGEAASKYHGANRLGGNSLLAALYSGKVAAEHISASQKSQSVPDFSLYIKAEQDYLSNAATSRSKYPNVYIEKEIGRILNENLGITRTEENLESGLEDIRFYKKIMEHIQLDPEVSVYRSIRVKYMLLLAEAIILSAIERRESRGAHIREDYPEKSDSYAASSIAQYMDGEVRITYRRENP